MPTMYSKQHKQERERGEADGDRRRERKGGRERYARTHRQTERRRDERDCLPTAGSVLLMFQTYLPRPELPVRPADDPLPALMWVCWGLSSLLFTMAQQMQLLEKCRNESASEPTHVKLQQYLLLNGVCCNVTTKNVSCVSLFCCFLVSEVVSRGGVQWYIIGTALAIS